MRLFYRIRRDQSLFASLAHEHSDCGSHARGGDCGQFGRGEIHQAVEDVVFNLKVNELSNIVESDSGFHLILRTE